MKRLTYLVLLVTLTLLPLASAFDSIGPNWEVTCVDPTNCQASIYSYEKYWNEGGEWEQIDESFSDCSSEGRTRYCTQPYYFTAQLDDQGVLSVTEGGSESTLRMISGLGVSRGRFQPSRTGNRVQYNNAFPSIDLHYYYLPHKVKEEIILNDRPDTIPEGGFNLTFERSGALAEFNFERPYLCDADYVCHPLDYLEDGNTIILELPSDFLMDEETEYPITIDPTLYLNNSKIRWNGYIYHNGTAYTRFSNPLLLSLSEDVNKSYRAGIEWNITGIAQGSTVTNITLTLYTETTGSDFDLNFYELSNYSGNYKDSNSCVEGNCVFFADMGDGKKFGEVHVSSSAATRNFSFDGGYTELENSIISKLFGFGIIANSDSMVSIGARDNADINKRPRLTISYGINASDGNAAMEAGINSSLPGNPFTGGQQIYLVNQLGQHYFGRFDRVASLNNQTWALNYIVNGDSFIGMPSLFRVLNVWENSSLTYAEIKNQVEVFINATKY